MYKGKRKRLRKRDLIPVITYEWADNRYFDKIRVSFKNTHLSVWTRIALMFAGKAALVDRVEINGQPGNSLEVTADVEFLGRDGHTVHEGAYVFLPSVRGRTYYFVEEDAP